MNVFDYFFESITDWDKPFIVGTRESVSYKRIYENSLKLASYLSREFGENTNILLICPNSEYFITVYLGILKSGNTCVPLNYATEPENLQYIVSQTESPVIFTSERLKPTYEAAYSARVMVESDLEALTNKEHLFQEDPSFDDNRLAEIIYTSGSTGEPKGVMISHGNIRANTTSIIQYLKLTEIDRMCVVLPFFYCYGLSLLHTHLRAGGSLVLNNNFIFIGSVIHDLINLECTGFAGVPSHFQILLKKSDSFKTSQFPNLRYVTQAGGKLHAVFIEEFVSNFPEIDFFVMYGQTEATARLSYLPPKVLSNKMSSIGIPIPGVLFKLVDTKGNSPEPGLEGELLAKGDNIMQGYFKDDRASSETIVDGWLHTGDIAIMDKDGFYYITARKKEIIKVGGKRVSPKEIEEVILSLPEVIDCSISSFDDPLLGEGIKATLVIEKRLDPNLMRDRIVQHCSKHLAIYKIPTAFEFEETMKLSATGKKVKK